LIEFTGIDDIHLNRIAERISLIFMLYLSNHSGTTSPVACCQAASKFFAPHLL
jgi:hypothetical protein